ncbi:MAG: response regulator [Limisphaerales bacterium]
MTTQKSILLVDDNEDDVFLMERALQVARISNPMLVVEDGQQAIDYLSGIGKFADRATYPLPAIVFLDLKLPFKSGHEVLTWIRSQPELETLVVVVLTSSNEPNDIKRCYGLGANSYLVKPPTPEELIDMAKSFKWYWLEYNRFHESSPAP